MVSGSVSVFEESWELHTGSYLSGDPEYGFITITGTVPYERRKKPSIDDMRQRMYEEPQPVIFVCAYCKCHNALGKPACVQCGAPLGYAKKR